MQDSVMSYQRTKKKIQSNSKASQSSIKQLRRMAKKVLQTGIRSLHRAATLGPKVKEIEITNSPLHIAVREGNNKSVDIILHFMSKVQVKASRKYRDILHRLVQFQNMKSYISSIPKSTN